MKICFDLKTYERTIFHPKKTEPYDAIIIGSGASGSWAAKELSEGGLHVLVLEAGPDRKTKDLSPSNKPSIWNRLKTRRRQSIQARHFAFRSKPHLRKFFVDDHENPYTTPKGKPFSWIRGKQVGGRLHVWGRQAPRMSDLEFKAASHDGFGDDWPLSYNDLVPYYDKVERFMGLSGTPEGLAHYPDGQFAEPFELNAHEKKFKASIERQWPDRIVTGARMLRHNPKAASPMLIVAQATGRMKLITGAMVSKILVNRDTGKAQGVEYIDRTSDETYEAQGKVVVVCGSTIESIRLLLNSATRQHPAGLGNTSDTLGRFLMDHCQSVAGGLVDVPNQNEASTSFQSPTPLGFHIPRFQNMGNNDSDFIRGYMIAGGIGRTPNKKDNSTVLGLTAFGEVLARAENRVTLAPHKKDAWGIPAPHISCTFSANEISMRKNQTQVLNEMVETAGMGTRNRYAEKMVAFYLRQFSIPGTTAHELGGIRMGNTSQTSVLNQYNQCWDVPNLFVTDGSCFVTSGCQSPTLTIMAITVRSCEYIVHELKRGNL